MIHSHRIRGQRSHCVVSVKEPNRLLGKSRLVSAKISERKFERSIMLSLIQAEEAMIKSRQ